MSVITALALVPEAPSRHERVARHDRRTKVGALIGVVGFNRTNGAAASG